MFLGNQKVLCQSDSHQNNKKNPRTDFRREKNLQATLLQDECYCNYVLSTKQQGEKQPKLQIQAGKLQDDMSFITVYLE